MIAGIPSSTRAMPTSLSNHPFGCRSALLKLPNELLSQIAECALERHAVFDYVVECASLASLSITCRRMRAICVPRFFHDVPITSEQSLYALSRCPSDLLCHVRCARASASTTMLSAYSFNSSENLIYSWMSNSWRLGRRARILPWTQWGLQRSS